MYGYASWTNSGHKYSLGDSEHLSSIDEIKDLGIWIDTGMNSSLQCQKATNKAMQALGQIKRPFKYIPQQSF